ncbi:MAG: LexA repressor [Legionellaceae bacterium]
MPSGGYRPGSGRPKGTGKYQEPTTPIRVPESLYLEIKAFVEHKGYKLPFYGCKVSAGFPSPADDFIDDKLDLNKHLVAHPASTFIVRVSGNSMRDANIHDSDLLIVDKSLAPVSGKIVVAAINGELTVKRYQLTQKGAYLLPENPEYPPIPLKDGLDVHIWGVVTAVIHHV